MIRTAIALGLSRGGPQPLWVMTPQEKTHEI